jgi:hypothetical protein
MQKLLFWAVVVVLLFGATTSVALADKPTGFDANGNEMAWKDNGCTKIQDGTLQRSDGVVITTGFDEWGYNYQGHIFNGMYCDYHPVYRPGGSSYDWCQANYGDVSLVMKWNDEWLANTDCSGDGLLDRHWPYPAYIGSGAWTTNHMWGIYEQDGQVCEWDYFVKIIAAPSGAYSQADIWYAADGTEIGPAIWGDFAIIQEVENDPCAGIEGVQYLSPDHAGFGGW